MSGGSYDYAFRHIDDLASEMLRRGKKTPLRSAFTDLLFRVSLAAKEIEWADSGDTEQGGPIEIAAILACFQNSDAAIKRASVEDIEEAIGRAQEAVKLLKGNL